MTLDESENSEQMFLARYACTLAIISATMFTTPSSASNMTWDPRIPWQYPCDTKSPFGSVLIHTKGSTRVHAISMAQLIIIKIANGKIASNTLTVTRFMRL
jgi:hypothetical protein